MWVIESLFVLFSALTFARLARNDGRSPILWFLICLASSFLFDRFFGGGFVLTVASQVVVYIALTLVEMRRTNHSSSAPTS